MELSCLLLYWMPCPSEFSYCFQVSDQTPNVLCVFKIKWNHGCVEWKKYILKWWEHYRLKWGVDTWPKPILVFSFVFIVNLLCTWLATWHPMISETVVSRDPISERIWKVIYSISHAAVKHWTLDFTLSFWHILFLLPTITTPLFMPWCILFIQTHFIYSRWISKMTISFGSSLIYHHS